MGRIKRISVPTNASGVIFDGQNHPKISIAFDGELFDKIKHQAIQNNVSFAEMVRVIVRWAFEQADPDRKVFK